jgi:3-oxoacyl-[acyl-carrier protein] reductase
VARGEERLRAVAEQVGGEYELCDVGDRDAVERAAAAIRAQHPAIKLLVNNAGIPGRAEFFDAEPDVIEHVTRVNYLGGVWCLRAFLPALRAAAPAHVVNIVSVAGTVAAGRSGPYTASKHAQLAFSRSIVGRLAGEGIRVHTILPGFIETPGFPQRRLLPRLLHWTIAEPEDVAAAILDALDRDLRERFVPGLYRLAALAQALTPGLVATLGTRLRKPA